MYQIQYYTKKEKPEFDKENYTAYTVRRRYLHQKDIVDKCWNIKSLTIDLDDIKNVIYDETLTHLVSLYTRISKLNTDNIESITILNNNEINLLYIYEIINCEWMVNKELGYSEELVFKKIKELSNIIEKYELNKQDQKIKNKLKNKMKLFKYYISSANYKEAIHVSESKTLKLGKYLTRPKKN